MKTQMFLLLIAVLALVATLFTIACSGSGQAPTQPPSGVATPTPPAMLRAQHALGIQRVLVLAVSFPNVKPDKSLSQIRNHVLEETADYYAKASYGKTTLVGQVKGWYPLPRLLDEYEVSPYNINVDRNRVRLLVEDALNAAEKDVLFNQFNHIIIAVGVETMPGVGYGMIAYSANPGMLTSLMRYGSARMETLTTRGRQQFSGGIIVIAENAHQGHIVHDLAHALGGAVGGKRPIPDLYDTVLQGKVGTLTLETYPKYTIFMGPWDVMSRHLVKPEAPAPGMSSFTRLRMGWISDDRVTVLALGESRAVTLQPLGNGKGTLVIKIPDQESKYYLLENRQILPGDPMLPATGLLVLQVDESREDGDGIVRVVEANPQVPDFGAATFGVSPGQTPSVKLSQDVAVEVVWQYGSDLAVIVTKQSLAPEIQATAKRIREIEQKLNGLPESAVVAQARAELTAAKELLLQMKVGDASAKVESISVP